MNPCPLKIDFSNPGPNAILDGEGRTVGFRFKGSATAPPFKILWKGEDLSEESAARVVWAFTVVTNTWTTERETIMDALSRWCSFTGEDGITVHVRKCPGVGGVYIPPLRILLDPATVNSELLVQIIAHELAHLVDHILSPPWIPNDQHLLAHFVDEARAYIISQRWLAALPGSEAVDLAALGDAERLRGIAQQIVDQGPFEVAHILRQLSELYKNRFRPKGPPK